ncbi:hypothetical protein Aca07nite_84390 [Actinoplanes capillaceus]|uniref:Uncharacterized protein n=1 Tax=Actinoplanes campanulatus TaxID=113559 RepID=A0ABQ3WY85_9ACTN|nr:hypothetical protein [Actinoplanes capillaceus]GID51164.1 hypothetical protein Aca07nite_84390 [Actinoplanes capillaceus]
MTTPKTGLRVYSHTLLHQPPDPRRWRFGYLAAPAAKPGRIRVSRAVAEQICRDLAQLRTEALEDAMADAEFYEDALVETDAILPRLYLDGEHLVSDWRHVTGDSDTLRTTDPDPDGWYTITLGLAWRQVDADDCDTVRDDSTATSPTTAAYQAYVGLFTDPAMALLDLTGRAGIAVAYLDRGAIEADTRALTDDEWGRIAYQLDDYDQHVSNSVDVNATFRDRIFAAAGVEQHLDDDPDSTID